jgi:heme-degrading monooxygenase HmoA
VGNSMEVEWSMFAVIFYAEINQLDARYGRMAEQLRDSALKDFGCTEFMSACEGSREIAISYWNSEADIVAWKANAQHRVAQALGKAEWYRSYRVQVVEIKREYGQGRA